MNLIEPNPSSTDMIILVEKKIIFFEDIIQKTLLHVKHCKTLDILSVTDVNGCINSLSELSKKIKDMHVNLSSSSNDSLINNLQLINNELSTLFKMFGTNSLEDMLWICFGNNYVQSFLSKPSCSALDRSKFELLKKYFHPVSYKVVVLGNKTVKEDKKNGKTLPTKEECVMAEQSNHLECFDTTSSCTKFHLKVNGVKLIIKNALQNKALIVTGIMDDVVVNFLNNAFINNLIALTNKIDAKHDVNFERYIQTLMLKDYLIYSESDLYSKYIGIQSNLAFIKNQNISNVAKEFISGDIFAKRSTIVQLLIFADNNEFQYLAYLLYDLLSNDTNNAVDTHEQTMIFDSFSWYTKLHFRDAMKQTVQYTNDLSNFDVNKIPLEQQICLLKVDDAVKEKAMQKLKEIKSKSEDSGSKARQYLDGLLKIPFKIFRREPILDNMKAIEKQFKDLVAACPAPHNIPIKNNYNSIEISKYVCNIKKSVKCEPIDYNNIIYKISKKDKKWLSQCAASINTYIQTNQVETDLLVIHKKDKNALINDINAFINICAQIKKNELDTFILGLVGPGHDLPIISPLLKITNSIEKQFSEISSYILKIPGTMDDAIYGHNKAKKQIERIICQWINGEQDGHCFGFEGPPGVGKTSLAKNGLSQCLLDSNGEGRPFAMIQIGGDSNGSSLHGHNYTYVGSNWGSIVQILIDKKCMNPIIFIDEVDKISKTEQGREIVGILTHLLDSTQNDCFQDKYFAGIDIDLSKALFILSYNDVDAIDRVLLDRIHRIKFSNLSVEEKLVICEKHILPDIYKKMGLAGSINISKSVCRYIIEEYTCEPGVRKLKEILFEIIGEINNESLKGLLTEEENELPITITKEMIQSKYLKERREIKHTRVHDKNVVGIINGLWANAMGQGGVIPIQTCFVPSSKFLDLTLTGLQGDVMKESMTVALTLAWSLTPEETKLELKSKYSDKHVNGIHIHCPEGSTPKDGPSAGTAITCAIYSLLNNKKIKCNYALTGEMSLNGCVTEIGGLDLKILGGIKAGVNNFIYPRENKLDFNKFMEKYKDNDVITGITFHEVSNIQEAINLMFE